MVDGAKLWQAFITFNRYFLISADGNTLRMFTVINIF